MVMSGFHPVLIATKEKKKHLSVVETTRPGATWVRKQTAREVR